LELIELCEELKVPLIQVGTDCVYSGNSGNYTESSPHDPNDLYGYSKTLGEIDSSFLQILRCSLIGRELSGSNGLMEWVLSQKEKSVLPGFINHRWNGLTTLHISKLINGIIKNNNYHPGNFHIIPKDTISKYDLVNEIAVIFGRPDLIFEPKAAKISVDRTLLSNHVEFNERIWRDAGYNELPSIIEMLKEYFFWVRLNPRISNHE
jgi:dTDP-4-dehydrorhamnose reductase